MDFPDDKPAGGQFKSKKGEHSNTACEGEETNPNLSSTDNSNASSEPYVIFTAEHEARQMHTNPVFIGDSGSFVDINTPTASINSNSDVVDETTERFMLQPGIHVPSNKSDYPNFKNRMYMGKTRFHQQQQTRDIPLHDSRTWPQVFRPRVDEVIYTRSPFTYDNNDVRLNDENEEESNPHQALESQDPVYLPSFLDNISVVSRSDLKSKKNCHVRKWIIFVFMCVCVSGVAAWIVHNKYGSDEEIIYEATTPSPLNLGKCENDITTATVGEQICIPYTQNFTSNPSGIHVKQLSSQYFSALQSFSINVSSDIVLLKNGDWIVNFNSSRTDQQLRFMKENATCDSVGIYEITIEYDDGNVTFIEFEISLKDPQLMQRVTRINDNIHIHCEMIKTCMASSVALFVNNGKSSRLIPNIDVCSSNDKNSGTTVSVDAIIPVSQFSENQTISCVPLMTDMQLAANLTSTSGIPVCEGDCVPDCKDDPQGEAYFPDKDDCTNFYQCSNGKLVSQTCSLSTYWSTSKCACVHFDDEICNRDTNSFFKPLLSIEKCTNASLV
ncbi:uncharacterized protein LOC127737590 [Mytilus californianus]|uniref:uncharacterized protein LOC127737590 n=1 Tax=Mytilus californianus TaxID=6549 RepID=UPI0022455EF2|nr:uncharacterized protein LOC127737590 [Mytilus californianus]